MEEAWDFYLKERDGSPLSVYLNLHAYSSEESPNYPLLLFFDLELLQKRQNGMTTNEEAETMYAIEEAMAEAIRPFQAKYVGRTTGGGRRVFHFYVAVSEVERSGMALMNVLKAFPQYELQCEIRALSDPQWQYYLKLLFPSKRDQHTITNRRVLMTLEEEGDQNQIPRYVDHWIYFKQGTTRQAFVDQIRSHGFVAKRLFESSDDTGRLARMDDRRTAQAVFSTSKTETWKCGVVIERKDSVLSQDIDALVVSLYDLAQSYDGHYDGWECKVITSPEDANEY